MKNCTNCKRDEKGSNGGTEALNETLASFLSLNEGTARSFACKLAGNSEDAKELIQEASVRALRHWQGFEPVKSFQAWYLAIIRNAFLDSRGRYEARFCVPLSAPMGGSEGGASWADVIADHGPTAQQTAERGETVKAVQAALKAIGAKYQGVVRLCFMEGMGYEEAARELGIPLGTVRSRLFRARKALRRQLAQEWEETKEIKEARKS